MSISVLRQLLMPGSPRRPRRTLSLPGSPWRLRRGLLLLLLPLHLSAQAWEAHQVLDSLRARFQRVEDYRVDIKVSLDMPGLRLPRKKMTFTFKQPDQTRLETRGFAMVPRRGMMLSPDSIFQEIQGLVVSGDTLLDSHPCLILRGLEKGPDNLALVAEVIIDRELWVVRALASRLEDSEVFLLRTEYLEAAPGIHMPKETHLRFQLNERFLRGRHGRHGPFGSDVRQPVLQDGEGLVGGASIVFTNYRINQGITDDFFAQ